MPWAEALIVGVLAALAFTHVTGWSPGGLITPGYLVLYSLNWRATLALLATAVITWAIAMIARHWLPLYGRRRWGFCVATAVVVRSVIEVMRGGVSVDPLGLVVPGLISSAMVEQGVGPTATGLITVTASTLWVLIVWGQL